MLSIGQSLLLEPKYSDNGEKLKCRLVERKDESILLIDYPINTSTNRTTFLMDGTQLKATFIEGNSVYLFETEVVGKEINGIPMIKLLYPGDQYLIKIQRRQFVRVETSVDIAIHPMEDEFKSFTTITEDISAGGSSILLEKNSILKEGMTIKTVVVLPFQNGELHYLNVVSKVIRIIKKEKVQNDLCSIKFMDITPQQRQLLLRFTFDRQIAMKKKGLEFDE